MKRVLRGVVICLSLTIILVGGSSFSSKEKSIAFRNGTLKIMQLTDIHYESGTDESSKALERMKYVIDIEKPDLIVFTGDVVLGPKQEQGWSDIAGVLNARETPWAMVLGNHDDEFTDWSRKQIMEHIIHKQGSLIGRSAKHVSGYCNYTLPVTGSDGHTAAVLYMFDSNNYSTIKGLRGYGWIEFDQIEWYRKESARYTARHKGEPLPALAFLHIPLREYAQMSERQDAMLVGKRGEKECCGVLNTGMYAAMLKAGDVMCTFAGHDHNNDYIGAMNGLGLAYGRFSGSKMTYTDIGYGARIIILRENERAFDTWIRTSEGEVLYKVHFPDDLVTKR